MTTLFFLSKGRTKKGRKEKEESRKNGPSRALPQTLGSGHFKAFLDLGGFLTWSLVPIPSHLNFQICPLVSCTHLPTQE